MQWPTILQTVGNTPLVRLQRVAGAGAATVVAKVESANPSGSVKDRTALALVVDAEKRGILGPGITVVEPSGGNMGVSLAMVCAARGYQFIATLPNAVSLERRHLLSRYGAEVRLSPASQGMAGAMKAAQALAEEGPGYVYLDQFRNAAAVQAHRETTAQELLRQTGGTIHAFVAGVGTGATLTGVGEVLKAHNPSVILVAVEPASSPMLSRGRAGLHAIFGIGADFVPPLLDRDIMDEVMTVSDQEAADMARRLGREEGLRVGPSSGANVTAALRLAQRLGPGAVVATVLPDTGERYVASPA